MIADMLMARLAEPNVLNRPLRWKTAFLALMLPLLALVPLTQRAAAADAPKAATQEYKLGPQDRLRLRVFEWRATVDTVLEWPSLNAEFSVNPSGSISLPILGEVPAAGLSTSDLAKTIGERLKATIGLAVAPSVGVEVVLYRPFYIMGGINKPGEYPYRPGLTVLQALSVAGGLLGSGESGLRMGREVIQSRGELQQNSTEIGMLLARKARLEAESANAEKVQFPPELEKRKAEPAIAILMQQEQSIFETRRNALRTEVAALEQLKDFLNREIESIQGQIKAQQTERELMKKELDNVATLVAKGLTAAPRQLEMERTISRMEGDRLRLESTLFTARQNISRTDIAIIEARNRRSNEVATDLRDTQTKLEIAVSKFNTSERLLYETQFTTPGGSGPRGKYQPSYTIVRDRKEIQATDATAVEPGDTLKVELPVPEGMSTAVARPTQ